MENTLAKRVVDAFTSHPEDALSFTLEHFSISSKKLRSKSFIDSLINLSSPEILDSITYFIYRYLFEGDDLIEYLFRKYLAKSEILTDWAIGTICRSPNKNLFKTMCRTANHDSKRKIIHNLITFSDYYENSYEYLDYLLSKYDLKHFNDHDVFYFISGCLNNDLKYSIFSKLLFKHGASPNHTCWSVDGFEKPILGEISSKLVSRFIDCGADPFFPVYPTENSDGVPLYHYLVENDRDWLDYLYSLNNSSISKRKLNTVDSWNRNILHIFVSRAKKENFYHLNDIFYYLVDLGINPNRRAVVGDEAKVVKAKMKGILPIGYGKTPKELWQEVKGEIKR